MIDENLIQEYRLKLSLNPTLYELQLEEKLLRWQIKYEKQKPVIANNKLYFLDFYLPQFKTYIEVDGKYHNTSKQYTKDCKRSKNITMENDFTELRLPNDRIKSISKSDLLQLLNNPSPYPSPPPKHTKKRKSNRKLVSSRL